MKHLIVAALLLSLAPAASGADPVRKLRLRVETKEGTTRWQQEAREKLFALMMGGKKPQAVPAAPRVLRRIEVPRSGYVLEELSLQSLPDRRLHAWLAVPRKPTGRVGAVLALHGHGGTGEQVVRGQGLYWYGRALAEMGYVVIAPDIGSHDLQHAGWSLMGERVWDALCCLDYVVTRPEVDPNRLAVAGLSLGGETTMYVAALDERIKAACSSGWLTNVANMKHGHCPCWNFRGLEEHFDFADVFACVAPRPLVCEIGEKERAPGGFPVEVARKAFDEVQQGYRVLGAEKRVYLDIHPEGHVFHGAHFWGPLREALGTPPPWRSETADTREALRRGEIARRAFSRALGVYDGWWAKRDRESGLFLRRLDQPVWAPQDNAADMLPFLFLTAHYLAPERLPDLRQVLQKEKELTTRLDALPDWYSLRDRRFVYEKIDVSRLIFNASEYCKDGLIPMTEVMGRGPWTERMLELIEAIFKHAPVASAFGALPADDTEVNGNMLQVLSRVYAMTREKKYLQWAERIGDAYCLEVLPKNGGLPPHRWDFQNHRPAADVLSLNDHGNELIGGLAELFTVTKAFHPEKAEQYRQPLQAMFRHLLEKGRNEDGLWFGRLRASTGEVLDRSTPDTWGYALAGTTTFARASDDAELLKAAPQALRRIDRPRYLDWHGADAYADSIEGALLLLNRFPEPEGFGWLEKVLPLFFGKQQDDGVVEGWYGDGNYARTALMVGLYYTQGTMCRPWRSDLCFGTVREGKGLRIAVSAEKAWQGKLVFDPQRHRLHLKLPVNYPRLNEFPEWFTFDPAQQYQVRVGAEKEVLLSGADLARGLSLEVPGGGTVIVQVTPR
jgi:hypothetical protein